MSGESNNPIKEPEFLRLFLKNEPILRAYARVLLPNWEAVDEVMQEVSIVIWNKLDQLENENGFLPWSKVIVRFESLKHKRNSVRDKHVFSQKVLKLLAKEQDEEPEDLLELEWKAMKHCLSLLSTGSRELLMTPYLGHGSVLRLANENGRTVNSLYKKIGRLREKLSACIENKMARRDRG